MKMVFNFNYRILLSPASPMSLVTTFSMVFAMALVGLFSHGTSYADTAYFSKRSVLTSFFPTSDKVTFQSFVPSAMQKRQLARTLGYVLPKSRYYFFVASTQGHVDGYAFLDEQMGQHKPITFAVKLSPRGVVLRQEVMVYREAHGNEIRSPRFRAQFQGKTVADSLVPNQGIDSISGATISSHAMIAGVRRALVLFHMAILKA